MGQHKISRVCIIHGYAGSSAIHWQTWLARKCERVLKIETHYPKLPEIYKPKLPAWLEALNRTMPTINEATALIGHSLACSTILQLLKRPDITQVGLVVLVAPSTWPNVEANGLNYLAPFFEGLKGSTMEQLKTKIMKAHVYASDNDKWVDHLVAQRLASELGAEFHLLQGAGHISVGSGYHTFPEVLELVRDS